MLQPIRAANRSNQVFEQLRDGILGGAYSPGDHLPTEREICSQLGVNRTSVREAIKRLEQARLVTVRHGAGTEVLDFRTHAGLDLLRDLLTPAGSLNPVALRSVLEMRLLIGGEISRLAAERATVEQLAILEAITERIEACPPQAAETLQEADFDFHYALADAAENLALLLVMNSIRGLYFEYRALFLPAFTAPFRHRSTYRKILRAVRDGDGAAAERLDRALLQKTNAHIWKRSEPRKKGDQR